MQTPFFLRGHTPQGLEGPRSHCGVCSEAPRVIYVSVLNHIVNASTYLCVINDLRYLALLVFTQAVLSQVTLPMGQNCGSPLSAKDCTNHPEHPQTQTPATAREHNTRRPASPAIMLRTGFHETKPMGQNCGSPPPAKDRANQPEHPETQTPATAREHNTRRSTSPAVMPQTGLHNTPLSAKRVSQGARPARDGSRQKSQASEPLLLLLPLKPHSFSARPIVAIRLPI